MLVCMKWNGKTNKLKDNKYTHIQHRIKASREAHTGD